MPALIAALLVVTSFYVLVTVAAIGAQNWPEFDNREASLAAILDKVTGALLGHGARCRRSDLDLLRHARDDVRPDPNPVRDGTRRDAAVDVRQVDPAA